MNNNTQDRTLNGRSYLFARRRSQPTMKNVVGWYGRGKTVEDYLKEYKERREVSKSDN